MQEFADFEFKYKMTLPDQYKNFILANGVINPDLDVPYKKDDRPYEFIYLAQKMRPKLLDIINDDYLFCLSDPDIFIK